MFGDRKIRATTSKDMELTESTVLVIPFENPVPKKENSLSTGSTDETLVELDLENLENNSTIVIHPVSDDPLETLESYQRATGREADDSVVRAAGCGPYWKRIGAEVLIYSSSFGGVGVATGLLIRFVGTPALLSMLLGNGMAVLVNENSRALITSLLNPHGEHIPDDQKERYEQIKKYAVHPISTVLTSTIGGTVVSLVGDTNIGMRQLIVSCTAQLGGLTTYLSSAAIRKFHNGTIVLNPPQSDVKTTMKQFYSTEQDQSDQNRPYLAGNIRNITTRVIGMMGATMTSWYAGAYMLENYCGPEGRQELLNMKGNFTGEDLSKYCIGGQATFLFRDWGVTAVNLVGFFVVQPVLNWGFNKIFDYFYQPSDDSTDIEMRFEDITEEEENK